MKTTWGNKRQTHRVMQCFWERLHHISLWIVSHQVVIVFSSTEAQWCSSPSRISKYTGTYLLKIMQWQWVNFKSHAAPNFWDPPVTFPRPSTSRPAGWPHTGSATSWSCVWELGERSRHALWHCLGANLLSQSLNSDMPERDMYCIMRSCHCETRGSSTTVMAHGLH